jgi:hypothetical protein
MDGGMRGEGRKERQRGGRGGSEVGVRGEKGSLLEKETDMERGVAGDDIAGLGFRINSMINSHHCGSL